LDWYWWLWRACDSFFALPLTIEMRYRLRTLLIVLAVGQVVLWAGYWGSLAAIRWQDERNAARVIKQLKEDLRREASQRR